MKIAVTGTGWAALKAVLRARAPRFAGSATELGLGATRSAVARLNPVCMEEMTGTSVGDKNLARGCRCCMDSSEGLPYGCACDEALSVNIVCMAPLPTIVGIAHNCGWISTTYLAYFDSPHADLMATNGFSIP
jgi:hypothetical protein